MEQQPQKIQNDIYNINKLTRTEINNITPYLLIKDIQGISKEDSIESLLYKTMEFIIEKFNSKSAEIFLKIDNKWFLKTSKDINQLKNISNFSEQKRDILEDIIKSKKVSYLNNGLNIYYPIIKDNDVISIVYIDKGINSFLENESDLLNLLMNQFSISLGNVMSNQKIINDLNQQITEKNDDLNNLKSTMINSEKMASLGLLIASIAHEINNPTNFVNGITLNLLNNFKDLKEFIFELAGEDAQQKFIELFEHHFNKIEVNLNDISEGTNRIKNIVNDLRVFSRSDENEMVNADITDGIISSINLIKSKYKKHVEFICDFQSKKEILCWPNQLNQVFMNIIINACQAIVEKQTKNGNKESGKLCIKTYTANINFKEMLVIEFTDNGIGMTKEIIDNIFKPFFTTKDIGNGTGLGMSITHEIISKHKGSIEIKSEYGVGSTFTLYLPIN